MVLAVPYCDDNNNEYGWRRSVLFHVLAESMKLPQAPILQTLGIHGTIESEKWARRVSHV